MCNLLKQAEEIVSREDKYDGKCKYAVMQIMDEWCYGIADNLKEDDRKLMIKVDSDLEGFWLLCAYTNGKMFEDFICMEAVEDCSQIDSEYKDDLEMALLTCIGWRVDNFKDNGYIADWMEDEE